MATDRKILLKVNNMRWKATVQEGKNTRIIKRFLLLPRCVDNEWRWLKVCQIRQKKVYGVNYYYWVDEAWD